MDNNDDEFLYQFSLSSNEEIELSEEQDLAINIYIESSSLINKLLNSGKDDFLNSEYFDRYYYNYGNTKEKALINLQNIILDMDSIFEIGPRIENDVIVYRGYKNNNIIGNGYISTSLSIDVAQFFANNNVLFTIHLHRGVPYIYLGKVGFGHDDEKEILLPRKGLDIRIRENIIDIYPV